MCKCIFCTIPSNREYSQSQKGMASVIESTRRISKSQANGHKSVQYPNIKYHRESTITSTNDEIDV